MQAYPMSATPPRATGGVSPPLSGRISSAARVSHLLAERLVAGAVGDIVTGVRAVDYKRVPSAQLRSRIAPMMCFLQ